MQLHGAYVDDIVTVLPSISAVGKQCKRAHMHGAEEPASEFVIMCVCTSPECHQKYSRQEMIRMDGCLPLQAQH